MSWFNPFNSKTKPLGSEVFRTPRPEGKRVRETYPTILALCHAWASGNAPRGRCSQVFFENGVIYSFGHHYAAAKIYTNKQGVKLVLLNEDSYSNATASHLSDIRKAVKHLNMLEVPFVDSSLDTIETQHNDNIETFSNRVANIWAATLAVDTKGAKSRHYLDNTLRKLEIYCHFFGLKNPLYKYLKDKSFQNDLKAARKLVDAKQLKIAAAVEKSRATREARTRELYVTKVLELEENFKKNLQLWLGGKLLTSDLDSSIYLRVESPYKAFGKPVKHTIKVDLTPYEASIKERLGALYQLSVTQWRQGRYIFSDNVGHIYPKLNAPALLRVRGNVVETSEGADVPLSHALRLLDLIEKRQAKKGERVGLYTLESVSDQNKKPVIITIGCHKIELSEAQAVLAPYRKTK